MEYIEKTVFLSYRRTNFLWVLNIFQDLTHNGYDVSAACGFVLTRHSEAAPSRSKLETRRAPHRLFEFSPSQQISQARLQIIRLGLVRGRCRLAPFRY